MAWLDDPDIIRFDSEHEREIYRRGREDAREEIIRRLYNECFPRADEPLVRHALRLAADVIEDENLGRETE